MVKIKRFRAIGTGLNLKSYFTNRFRWQQNFGEDPIKPGRPYLNREFILKSGSLGLHPKLGVGYNIRIADGSIKLLR